MLPIVQSAETVDKLFELVDAAPGYELSVDLPSQSISDGAGFQSEFEIDPFRKRCLLEGLDDIGLTLLHADKITAFEAARA